MNIIKKSNTPFFLTGGTALSRHYYNHRYSDDLDLFVISDSNFNDYADIIINQLIMHESESGFRFNRQSLKKFETTTQFFIENKECNLKIDLVNDINIHYGEFEESNKLGKVDSLRNIFSNKFCALFRFEPKDIVDIWIIYKRTKFQIKEIISEAKEKETGVEPETIYKILKSFPVEQLEKIKWVIKPDYSEFKRDLDDIADRILYAN